MGDEVVQLSDDLVKTRFGVTLTRPYLKALNCLVNKGIYMDHQDGIRDALRRLFQYHGIKPFFKGRRPRARENQYDKIIDQFIECEHKLVEITVENRTANYISNMLNTMIGKRGLEKQVKASYVEEWVYLEKVE